MASFRLSRLAGAVVAACLSFACGGNPQVDAGGDSDSGGDDGGDFECESFYGDACGQACDDETPCPKGLHCSDEACTAECKGNVGCDLGETCSSDGRCSGSIGDDGGCTSQTCEELGHACGQVLDECGHVLDCADEGLGCASNEMCVGGIDSPTRCVPAGGAGQCDVCGAIPSCDDEPQTTILRGRVVSPGRSDDDTANQVGIPNALVYILRSTDIDDLPAIPQGLPASGSSCDRCEDQDYGPVLAGAVSNSSGHFEIETNIPVGVDFLLVVKAGKFRRAVELSLPASAACDTTELPENVADNPTRLPRDLDDGLAVNIPHVAIVTGQLDAMECVFNKMGIADDQFGLPGSSAPIHLYRSNGAWPADAAKCPACQACSSGGGGASCRATNCTTDGSSCSSTCRQNFLDSCNAAVDAARLTEDDGTITDYDMVVFDCEGSGWDSNVDRESHNLREYVNRGGRAFASHLSFTWLHPDADGDALASYDEDEPLLTGLGSAASWLMSADASTSSGFGRIALERDHASPRIQSFADWMISEDVVSSEDDTFSIQEPRSQIDNTTTSGLGPSTEEFVYCQSGSGGNGCNGQRSQQFSFNTPYGAPEDDLCGRVAYSAFHVSVGNSGGDVFPSHCAGDLSDQEKVLLYMLFDLGACVGDDPPPPPCTPITCPSGACGNVPNGCGQILDCGTCGGDVD